MGEESKTITRAAHVPWFDAEEADVKNLIPLMSGNVGEEPPPWQTGESGEEGPVDEDDVDVKGEAFEDSAPAVDYSA
eukprot:3833988-Alexandrium_andersonii.AAC.1